MPLVAQIYRQLHSRSDEGLGLVEVILSLGVAIIVIVALVSLAVFTLRTASSSSRMLLGTRLANQEIETIRAVRDTYLADPDLSWSDFYDLISGCVAVSGEGADAEVCPEESSCHVDLDNPAGVVSGPTEFDDITVCLGSRAVFDGDEQDSSKIDVITVATWMVGGQRKYTHNYTRLTNWAGD